MTYDRSTGEESPIGLILCSSADTEQVELMDLNAANIRVAEYLDHMPDMKLMQTQLHRAVALARERVTKGLLPHASELEGEK
uniref:YhcG PDDEXK nuclease domain-containing protein n=1 Tax=mine drainage metagenome TaxID=410659 RepID=E6QQ13_9ZZZZ